MKISYWFNLGIRVKRWILFGILGILLIAFGFTELVNKRVYDIYYKGFYLLLNITGIFVIYISISEVSDIMDYNDVNKYVEIVMENNSFLVDNIFPDFITSSTKLFVTVCAVIWAISSALSDTNINGNINNIIAAAIIPIIDINISSIFFSFLY